MKLNGGNNLEVLKELTEKLPPFPPAVEQRALRGFKGDKREEVGIHNEGNLFENDSSSRYREYKMTKGECFAWFIHRSGKDVAVHRWFNSKGSEFPEHAHLEKEWLIIYKGTMELLRGGEKTVLKVGDSILIEPKIKHSAYFPEECKYITITIPPAEEFPNDTR